MAEKTNSGLVKYAKAQVGKPYWYGTFGQTATASLLAEKKKQYPSYYTASDFESQIGERVHDCIGLIKGYLWSSSTTGTPTYNSAQDKSASGMYAAATVRDAISTFPKTKGLLLFKGTSTSKITHVGIYNGGSYVFEAKSHADGVVRSTYKQSDWDYWAQCPYCTDDTSSASSTKAAATDTAQPKEMWTYLMSKIGNACGVAGLMGNLYAESGLIPNNLQNTGNTKLGLTDAEYTAQVDAGTYTKFASDSIGYGLAQWTYSSRKKALLAYAEAQNASIGNQDMQLAFLIKELSESYQSVLGTLCTASTVLEASNAVLTGYEKPANQGSSVQAARAKYGQKYYDAYAGSSSSSSSSSSKPSYTVGNTYTVQVDGLTVRTGAGKTYSQVSYANLTANAQKNAYSSGLLKKGTVVTCKTVKTVGNDIWMQIPSGWIAAYYSGSTYVK